MYKKRNVTQLKFHEQKYLLIMIKHLLYDLPSLVFFMIVLKIFAYKLNKCYMCFQRKYCAQLYEYLILNNFLTTLISILNNLWCLSINFISITKCINYIYSRYNFYLT